MRPPRLVVRAYVRRAAVIWLTMRLALSAVFLMGSTNPLDTSPVMIGIVVALSAGLTLVDIGRRHESLLIGNLAISPAFIFALATLPALVGEVAIRVMYSSVA